ncbi:Uma2 family endonuclease [Cyanothece sp. BG0011]|uniref:Uma2 family endonuclease n=1 Tax=Cyanothece sp. BG0011 TaxID=2082950 RepID=UPI000D1E6394|nr:Uma2 family endonuclease [Cyanothece sp. BG0011]
MINAQTKIILDQWIPTKWEDFLNIIGDPVNEKRKAYYYHHHMRLEMLPVGFDHSKDHSLISLAINLLGIVDSLPINLLDNCSFRKADIKEFQPNIAAYTGEKANIIPSGTNIVNLNQYSPPDLVVEIAKTSFLDDIGTKRSLYESLDIKEYWVVDVNNCQIIAYSLESQGSYKIESSHVFSGLKLAILEEALHKSRQEAQSTVGQWLMTEFQK